MWGWPNAEWCVWVGVCVCVQGVWRLKTTRKVQMSNVVVNRTAEFRQIRDETRRRQDIFKVPPHTEHQYRSIIPQGVDETGDVELVALNATTRVPDWLVDIEAAHCSLDNLKSELAAYQRMQSQHMMDVFVKDTRMALREVMAKSNEVTSCIRQAEEHILKLRNCKPGTDSEERTIRLNASRNAAKSFEELSKLFRKKQNFYMRELEKRQLVEQPASVWTTDNATAPPEGSAQQTQQQLMIQREETEQSRQTQISQLATTMQEVEGLFDQSRSMAIEQGSMLDRIDVNVEQAVDNTDRARIVLHKIENKQRHGIVKQVSVVLMSVNVAMFVLVLIKWWPR
eukprot:Gregarina_sp_Pseudo_9__5637@NODE_785_length_2224_cov_15_463158_g739_i0_p1_GENE_NODE_785_length_2224_cov_15_463158_g739_i0NODE_785_length_2224_cov_15_463158_g739_i0_p1_ORF_typecomplete_len340_score57_26Syntaxin/PF00804_25/2_6e03Syntaxin/PF00804_25/8_6e08SNARE/PF05739_19/1_2e04SNARE/PF05739_19/1_6e06Glycoprot_B_PH1/PF17416_2/0_98Glycoprot_B_PH1/PF17416_2/35_NODE_785_length_2224_cov_15_463158_g739_i011202139